MRMSQLLSLRFKLSAPFFAQLPGFHFAFDPAHLNDIASSPDYNAGIVSNR